MTITFTHIIGQICVNSWILITFLVFFNIFLSRGAKIVLLGIKIILYFILEQIWDHFYTRDPPMAVGKSGLGFALAQSIAEILQSWVLKLWRPITILYDLPLG